MLSIKIEPRVSETDGLQHINNTVMPVWFETGREPTFRLFNEDLNFNKWPLILAHISVDFKDQTYYQFPVTINTWVESIGNSSYTVGHNAVQQDKICAEGKAVLVHYDYEKQVSKTIPDTIRKILESEEYQKR